MKRKIEWHENRLRRKKLFLKSHIKSVINDIKILNRSIKECQFCEQQIKEAKKQKMDSFDYDKFLIKKKIIKLL